MDTVQGKNYAQYYVHQYHHAIENEKYDDALEIAMRGYFVAKDLGDEEWAQKFLNEARGAVVNFMDQLGELHATEAEQGHCCSFCDRKVADVKIAKGWHGSICEVCVTRLYELFTEKKSELE